MILNRIFSIIITSILTLMWSSTATSVTEFKTKSHLEFIKDLNELKGSLHLPVVDKLEVVKIPKRKLTTRINKGKENGPISPVKIYIPKDVAQLDLMVTKLAKTGLRRKLLKSFLKKLQKAEANNSDRVKITLTKLDYKMINYKDLQDILSKPHHKVTIKAAPLFRNKKLRHRFFQQLKPYINKEDRFGIYAKLKQNVDLSLEKDLLPRFPRKMIKKFIVYRGPNCFHASLAFQGARFTKSPNFNIKVEKGYHKAMVNYDELWRMLTLNFYEVDTSKSKLRYGDLLVFFDIPGDAMTLNKVNFRWIRHAATYLFGPYTFSKGSKSPSTPYTIKTLNEEWKTWNGYAKNLGMKVFRRSQHRKKAPPFDLTDWIY